MSDDLVTEELQPSQWEKKAESALMEVDLPNAMKFMAKAEEARRAE